MNIFIMLMLLFIMDIYLGVCILPQQKFIAGSRNLSVEAITLTLYIFFCVCKSKAKLFSIHTNILSEAEEMTP